ncbi:DDE_Tnp_1-associated family protein [Escherichia coli 2-156-04_S4_C2]|nr:DDE_Tnp_1-associated family protein [Escherichia coli 2-156-04_S4_C2]
MELKKLMEHISIIPDYKQAWKVEHKLSDILLLTICAVISGAEGWEDIEDFGEIHLDFLKQYGDFENGIPVHDTIARVVSCISPAKFHECFINWMRDCHSSDDKDVIAIDGKTLRHSYDKSAAGEQFMSLVRSQQCTVWSSDRSRRMRNLMRLQLSQNLLTC